MKSALNTIKKKAHMQNVWGKAHEATTLPKELLATEDNRELENLLSLGKSTSIGNPGPNGQS